MSHNPFAITPKTTTPQDPGSNDLGPDYERTLEVIQTERAMLATCRALCAAAEKLAADRTGEQVIPVLLQEARAMYFAATGNEVEGTDE